MGTVDYGKKMRLPTPMQTCEQYGFVSKIAVNNLLLYEFNRSTPHAMFWSEMDGCTDMDHTISSLKHFMITNSQDHYIFISDNCPSQFRNHILMKFIVHMVDTTKCKSIQWLFLLKGMILRCFLKCGF